MNSLYNIIKLRLDSAENGKAFSLYSYRDIAHFKKLWEFDPSLKTGNIIIVWDGIASDTLEPRVVITNKYLTPIDWAVGFSLSIKDRIGPEHFPELRILILDDFSQSVPRSDSLKLVYQYSNMAVLSMPWIGIFSAKPSDSVPDIKAFNNTLNTPGNLPSLKDAFDEKTHDLDIIKGIWAANITKPSARGDSHAIANLVGPLLLTKEYGDLHINALQTLMRSVGLLPEEAEDNDALLTKDRPWISWKAPENGNKQLKLILVDDMFEISWGKVLCWAVGVDYEEPNQSDGKCRLVKISKYEAGKGEKIVVKASSSADWIIDKLKNHDDQKDRRFKFFLDDVEDVPEILFLDLRLYTSDIKEEGRFFKELLVLARNFIEGQVKNLPWPGFSNEEIASIEKWIENPDKVQDGLGYIEALTLLPRILALTDLFLPIVLFSSTGRRDITETLKPYGNIITVMEKPRLTVDISVDIALQTKRKFLDAMEDAFSVLTGRQVCRKVKNLSDKAESCAEMIPAGTVVSEFKHIEIYIDESGRIGQKKFAVGGLIMVYPKYEDVNILSEDLKSKGCYWYSDNEKDCTHLSKTKGQQNKKFQGACADTSWEYDKAKEILLELCSKKGIFVSSICVKDIKVDNSNTDERHILLKDVQGDARFRKLFSVLLELAIYEYIPELIRKKNDNESEVTLSIFPATRISRMNPSQAVGMLPGHNPNDYYGYRYMHEDDLYATMAPNSISPIVAGILKGRKGLHKKITLHHARGVMLQYGVPNYKNKKNTPQAIRHRDVEGTKESIDRTEFYIRRQHYFADHVLDNGSIKEEYNEEFKTGFVTESDGDMERLIDARRMILDDDTAAGIIQAAKYVGTEVKDKMHCHLLKKIGESLRPEHFSGFEFRNVLEGTKEDMAIVGEIIVHETKMQAQPVTVRIEQIKKKGDNINHYVCCDVNEDERRVLIKQSDKKRSGITSAIEEGDVFEVILYSKDGSLYGTNLIRIDKE